MQPCGIDGCENEGQRQGLCWTHVWRRRFNKTMCEPVRHYGLHPLVLLKLAMERYSEAEEDDEYRRASWLVRKRASLYRKAGQVKIPTTPRTL